MNFQTFIANSHEPVGTFSVLTLTFVKQTYKMSDLTSEKYKTDDE